MRYHVRSRGAATDAVEVCLADTTGELSRLLQLGEVVFVGKSLPPHTDGQTPVEAAGLGRAVVFGPGMANFRVIAEALRAAGAASRVRDAAALEAEVVALLDDPTRRAAMAAAGTAWHVANRGAVARTLAALREQLGLPD